MEEADGHMQKQNMESSLAFQQPTLVVTTHAKRIKQVL
jgi:hypothetical protein